MLLENGRGGSGASAERDIEGVKNEEGSGRRTLNGKNNPVPTDGDMCSWKGSIDESQNRSSESAGSILQSWDPFGENTTQDSMWPDVVERGLLSMGKATELVNRYTNLLLPHCPVVPISCPAHELRKTKPILFLAVLAASAATSDPVLHFKLNQETQELYARKITIQGHKSLELVQALCISILWPYPPKKYMYFRAFLLQRLTALTVSRNSSFTSRSIWQVCLLATAFASMYCFKSNNDTEQLLWL